MWKKNDLEELVANQIPESLTLDYKSSDALIKTDSKRRELAKDVSAMANSAGGVLIYGVKERKGGFPDCIDEGTDISEIPPEWFDQVVNSLVHPRISGIGVNPVLLGTSTERVAYVIVVPQSVTAHMASDHIYHKRYGTITSAMEDYEIRDVMGRESVPRLNVSIMGGPIDTGNLMMELKIKVENEAITLAEHFVLQIIVPRSLQIESDGRPGIVEMTISDTGTPLTSLIFQYGGIGKLPIWKGLSLSVLTKPLRIQATQRGTYPIGWRVTAPRMDWRNGEALFTF
jgi:hypothetical protein